MRIQGVYYYKKKRPRKVARRIPADKKARKTKHAVFKVRNWSPTAERARRRHPQRKR